MSHPLILVVEDNIPLLEGIKDLLEVSDYEVLTAENGREALKLLEDHRPDLIVSDIMMPELDGYEFHTKVREKPELIDIPFIFLTARGEKADIRLGKQLGADDYITKPFEDEDLLVAVQAKLTRWKELRQAREEILTDIKHKILLTLSHEFRTPLTYIINYSEMIDLERGELEEDDFNEFMQGIKRGANRLNRLVEDFLILVELNTGEAADAYRYRRRVIEESSPWLRLLARSYQDKAESKGLKLEIEVPDHLPPITIDEAYFSDAVGRLLDNAIKFSTPSSETIWLRAVADSENLRISVEDEGEGITEEDQADLFNVFQQIDRAKREQQGTGSGLAICSGIVSLHQGEVYVESDKGEGSTFTIVIPIKPPEGS